MSNAQAKLVSSRKSNSPGGIGANNTNRTPASNNASTSSLCSANIWRNQLITYSPHSARQPRAARRQGLHTNVPLPDRCLLEWAAPGHRDGKDAGPGEVAGGSVRRAAVRVP